MNKKLVSEVMREMGRKGGTLRMKTMTKDERKTLAEKAAARSAEVRTEKAKKKKAAKKPN